MRCLLAGLFWATVLSYAPSGAAQSEPPRFDPTGPVLQAHGLAVGYGLDPSFDPAPVAPCCEAIASPSSGSMAFGGGIGAGVGYGVSRVVTVLAGGDASFVTSDFFGPEAFFDLPVWATTLDLGVRLYLPLERPDVVPYAEVMGSRFYLLDSRVGLRGDGLTLGAGLLSTVSERLAVRYGLQGTFGSYDTLLVDGSAQDFGMQVDASNVRLAVGLVFYPVR